jgi:hypothetical protein
MLSEEPMKAERKAAATVAVRMVRCWLWVMAWSGQRIVGIVT